MTDKNTGGPAFPCEVQEPLFVEFDGETRETTRNVNMPGMTLRDYFAAKAMQGWSANPIPQDATIQDVAAWAYRQADAMLEARQS